MDWRGVDRIGKVPTGDDGGLAEVDFASGGFMVGSPAVPVTVPT
ncbi:hypothetical protein [Amaricoccus sp.]|nr:hypothetical protein [Amaricoccus sp.]HMR53265.1 hypothetical protein [Amaricoccus sp.]HMR59662.1 hypothetical protein [Amaricoccus sp.]